MKLEIIDYNSENSTSSEDEDMDYIGQNSSDMLQQQHRRILASLDGIHSGVPTRTTSTLTPTTLRNIEQTFFELTNDPPTTVPCQAGFVPPLPTFNIEHETHDNNSIGSTGSSSDNSSWQSPPQSTLSEELISGTSNNAPVAPTSRRNMGGRRPKLPTNLTPEEEEKRKVRRERNKLAAARCRKRRVDQTNELVDKVNVLEKEKTKLQSEIQELQGLKEDLEFCLDSHRSSCKFLINNLRKSPNNNSNNFKPPLSAVTISASPSVSLSSSSLSSGGTAGGITTSTTNPSLNILNKIDRIKVEVLDPEIDEDGPPPLKQMLLSNKSNPIMSAVGSGSLTPITLPSLTITSSQMATTPNTPQFPNKPNRPSSLNVPHVMMTPSQALGMNRNIADIAGVQITTPSTCIVFNFDSLMDGGTGLTPVSQPLMPNCSSQNKNPLDLATPTSEPSKLYNERSFYL